MTTVAYSFLRAESRANSSFVSGLYKDRPSASSRPTWFRKLDAAHNDPLLSIKMSTARCAWMLEKLSRDLIAPSVRASCVAGVL